MDNCNFKVFIEAQRAEIAKHRWIESEKAGRDLGQEASIDWIAHHAKAFRDWWDKNHGNG